MRKYAQENHFHNVLCLSEAKGMNINMICDNLYECCENKQFICKNKINCIEYRDSRDQAVCTEKGKRYNLINDKKFEIALFHMDGGIVCCEENEPKCDYLYIVYDQQCPTAIFVELKGKDIRHAINQLKKSIDRYGLGLKKRICARIVCNSVPRLYNDPLVKNFKKELMKRYKNGTLVIFEKSKDENYSNI